MRQFFSNFAGIYADTTDPKESPLPRFTFATRTEGFDNHIDKSIRGYSDLWNDILKLSEYFVEDGKTVVDLGCSTGKLLVAMQEQNKAFAPDAYYQGYEIEPSFKDGLDALEDNGNGNLTFFFEDAAEAALGGTTLVTSIFTLQFMSPSVRRKLMKRIYEGLEDGGAFILAEKTISKYGKIQDIRTFTHYDHKRGSFEDTDILDKEAELRHMMKPNTREELENMLWDAGFSQYDSFWQNHSFVGWIAIK